MRRCFEFGIRKSECGRRKRKKLGSWEDEKVGKKAGLGDGEFGRWNWECEKEGSWEDERVRKKARVGDGENRNAEVGRWKAEMKKQT